MSHLYPLARSAAEALESDRPAARTRYEAERLAHGTQILKLATEWISETEGGVSLSDVQANAGLSNGFIQVYEDEAGNPVYAVTYWQLADTIGEAPPDAPAKSDPQNEPASERATSAAKPAPAPAEDHTDDLYFRAKRTKRRGRKRHVDPRQMDLFAAPDARGYEHTEGGAVITDEEGDGTTFGG
ncbi:MAG: hypothetical protein AAFQ22_04280 [Pseudomonadota bacterium]